MILYASKMMLQLIYASWIIETRKKAKLKEKCSDDIGVYSG